MKPTHRRDPTLRRADADNDAEQGAVWVVDEKASDACIERLGDARRLADALGTCAAGLLVGGDELDAARLVQHGADLVFYAKCPSDADAGTSTAALVNTACHTLGDRRPRAVLMGGDPRSREWAALVAATSAWRLVSPALIVEPRAEGLIATHLDATGQRARRLVVGADETIVATMRSGVAEPWSGAAQRAGRIAAIELQPANDPILQSRILPGDPSKVDIRYADRLVAGGRGVGGKEGFDALRQFADAIDAGVAASRMAVDQNWIEHDRQVGQTGKTVAPELYIACGISGASHHIQGMSQSRHIVAINTDPDAPIFRVAHLGLAADLFGVLERARGRLQR